MSKFIYSHVIYLRFQHFSYAVEIAGGLGPTAGQIIRIGLMGENARSIHVATALNVLREALRNIRTLSNL